MVGWFGLFALVSGGDVLVVVVHYKVVLMVTVRHHLVVHFSANT